MPDLVAWVVSAVVGSGGVWWGLLAMRRVRRFASLSGLRWPTNVVLIVFPYGSGRIVDVVGSLVGHGASVGRSVRDG